MSGENDHSQQKYRARESLTGENKGSDSRRMHDLEDSDFADTAVESGVEIEGIENQAKDEARGSPRAAPSENKKKVAKAVIVSMIGLLTFVGALHLAYRLTFGDTGITGAPDTGSISPPTIQPSSEPSSKPSQSPTTSHMPSMLPSTVPSAVPSTSRQPSFQPSSNPSKNPTEVPSAQPSSHPSPFPSSTPSSFPSAEPSVSPTSAPSASPSGTPSTSPTTVRNLEMSQVILSVSGSNVLGNSSSPQSMAAEWIVNDDPRMLSLSGDDSVTASALKQRYIMAAVYFALGGETWSEARSKDEHSGTSWLRRRHECSWHGVLCTDDNKVIELVLQRKRLGGTLCKELFQLTSLRKIDFQKNRISGHFPEITTLLDNLTHLDLSANDLQGSIPDELYSFRNLTSLYLNRNKLTGTLSSKVGQLSLLRDLRLDENMLTGQLPSNLGQLADLKFLIVRENRLFGKIPPIGLLKKLFYIDVSRNEMTGFLPTQFPDTQNLTHIYFDGNFFSGPIPTQLGDLKLHSLYLSNNSLTGVIPEELGKLVELNTLYLQDNPLSKSTDKNGKQYGMPNKVCDLAAVKNWEVVELEADCNVCTCQDMCRSCRDELSGANNVDGNQNLNK